MLERLKNKEGFSFIDVIIALAITGTMAICILPIVQNFFTTSTQARIKNGALETAQSFAEKVKNSSFKKIEDTYQNKEFQDGNYLIRSDILIEKDKKNVHYSVWSLDGTVKYNEFDVLRVYTHYTDKQQLQYVGNMIDIPLTSDVVGIQYKIWGAGGGRGGDDQSPGNIGGSAGSVSGQIDLSSAKAQTLSILVGQAGIDGGAGGGTAGAEGAAYGGGGKGGGTGWYGSSGAGASGGGRSAIFVDGVEIATAGGGGGGGGGSYNRIGLQGSQCSVQIASYVGGTGQTSPVDGGGGGGGGGGHYGGLGGSYGADESRGGYHAGGGCYGGSYSTNVTDIIYNPWASTPGNASDSDRGFAGSPGKDGKVVIYIERESEASI